MKGGGRQLECLAQWTGQATAAYWIARVNDLKSDCAEMSLLRMELEDTILQREIDVQRVAAFWIQRLSESKAQSSPLVEESSGKIQQSVSSVAVPSNILQKAWMDWTSRWENP